MMQRQKASWSSFPIGNGLDPQNALADRDMPLHHPIEGAIVQEFCGARRCSARDGIGFTKPFWRHASPGLNALKMVDRSNSDTESQQMDRHAAPSDSGAIAKPTLLPLRRPSWAAIQFPVSTSR